MTDTTAGDTAPASKVTINDVLTAVDTALTVIKTIAETPGVNMLPYAGLVSSAITAIQAAERLSINIAPYVIALKDTFSGGVPSQADMDALDQKIALLNAEINAALPPAEPGEPADEPG